MNKRIALVAVALLVGGVSGSAYADMITYSGTTWTYDTMINSVSGATSYGNNTLMQVRSASAWALIKFDIFGNGAGQIPIGTGTQITGVTLRLYCTDGGGTSLGLADRTWTESETYNSWVAKGAGFGTVIIASKANTANQWTSYVDDASMIAAVQAWADGSDTTNDGFILGPVGTTGATVNLNTSEAGANKPELIVSYNIVPEPATAGMLLLGMSGMLLRRRTLRA